MYKYSDIIIPLLKPDPDSDLYYTILGLLELPKETKLNLLSTRNVPDKVKARLGDKAAEQRLIDKFLRID